jgi:phage gp46-like protein
MSWYVDVNKAGKRMKHSMRDNLKIKGESRLWVASTVLARWRRKKRGYWKDEWKNVAAGERLERERERETTKVKKGFEMEEEEGERMQITAKEERRSVNKVGNVC